MRTTATKPSGKSSSIEQWNDCQQSPKHLVNHLNSSSNLLQHDFMRQLFLNIWFAINLCGFRWSNPALLNGVFSLDCDAMPYPTEIWGIFDCVCACLSCRLHHFLCLDLLKYSFEALVLYWLNHSTFCHFTFKHCNILEVNIQPSLFFSAFTFYFYAQRTTSDCWHRSSFYLYCNIHQYFSYNFLRTQGQIWQE